ncbi:MAG: hypothetical protein A2V65_08520 [Deltaproteobacteria bacterium RBG_13_49_15]|nr:MAG: hypothetical protein A2V65_08520 [Deltaproteobacteria bacterium RBG_13_49_15]
MVNTNPQREPTRDFQKKYCKRALTAAIFIGLITILAGFKSAGKGLVLGTLFSVANFIALAYLLPLNMHQKRVKASIFSFLSIVGRYALMVIPLILTLKMKDFYLPATVAGLFMVQITILVEQCIQAIKRGRGISI